MAENESIPDLPVPYIFETFGSQLPICQVTRPDPFQIYGELEDEDQWVKRYLPWGLPILKME